MTSSVFTTSSSLASDGQDDMLDSTNCTTNYTIGGGGGEGDNNNNVAGGAMRGGRRASTERSPPLVRFSKALRGRNTNVTASGLAASRMPEAWSHSVVCAVDADPLVPGRSCLVRLHQHARDRPQALVGGLNIAVIDDFDRLYHLSNSPFGNNNNLNINSTGSPTSQSELPPYLCPDLEKRLGTGIWTECISNDLLSDGCRLWICYGFDGSLHYFINNNYCGRLFAHYSDNSNNNGQYISVAQHFSRKTSVANVNHVNVKRMNHNVKAQPAPAAPELWLIFDLYGSTTGIEIVATADGVNWPNEVFVGGHEAIEAYAEACQESGILPESDVPIVFIGPPHGGKTTMCNALSSGVSANSLLEGTPFASINGSLMKFAEQMPDGINNLSGSLSLQDGEQWYGAYLCNDSVRQRPKRKSKTHGVFLGGPKSSDHLLRMSVSSAQNLVLQALTQYEEKMRQKRNSAASSPTDEQPTSPADHSTSYPDPASEYSPKLPSFLPPNVVASTPNDLLLLAQTMFDEIVLADESGSGGTTGVIHQHVGLVRSPSRTSTTSSIRRRAGCAGLSFRLCDPTARSPISYWLSPILLLPKAIYVIAFDLTRIETSVALINELAAKQTASSTSSYLDELATWLELIYLRYSEANQLSPWSAPVGSSGEAQHDEIFEQNSSEPFLPSVVLVGTRVDRLATHQAADTIRTVVNKLKYVADWFSGRPFFRHVVGLTAFVPTISLPHAVTSCLGTNSSVIASSSMPSICSIGSLRRSLESMARQQPITKNFLPRRWVDLDEVMADLAADGLTFLTTEQLKILACESCVTTESELAAYVRYAHAMGRLHYATASMGAGQLHDNSISNGIVFVNPHNLINIIANSLSAISRSQDLDGDVGPPLLTEDRLHGAFQKQTQLANQVEQQQQQHHPRSSDAGAHRALRWVTWLLDKLDIATPWLLRPNENSLYRRFVLMPLVPPKPSSNSSCELLGISSAGSPLFTFYVDFKSTATDFLYSLFLCRCLRWLVARANQLQQQQSSQGYLDHSGASSGSWSHQLSRTVSYLKIDEQSTGMTPHSSLVIAISNQIAQYNRIKISIRALSNKTNEEPILRLEKDGTMHTASGLLAQPDTIPRVRTFSDSRTLNFENEASIAVNQQAVLAVLNDLRKCVLRSFGDLQTSLFHRLSFQLSVACPCVTSKCALHDKIQCGQEACVHLISLSECLTNACVTCEFDGRTNTAPIRAWFPSVVMPTCTVDDDADQSPILAENVLVDTFDNIELHKGSFIPQWLKTAAKLMNIEDVMDNANDGYESDGEDGKGWVELARLLGYHEASVQHFADDVNSSLALLCDWIITAGNNQLAIDVLLSYLEQMGRQDVVGAIRTGRRSPKTVQVFISYQYDTQADVRALCEWLQFRGYSYWLDDAQMSGGDQLAVEIERAIRNCRVFLACLSPRYLVSQHCHREIWLADLLNKPIVPIVFEKIPWPPPGPLGLVLARLVYVDMKGVGGHGGGGLEADFLGRLSQVIDIVAGYMPHSASPNGRAQAHSGALSVLRARSQRNSGAPLSAHSIGSRSQLIGSDGQHANGTGGNSLAVRVQSCTGCSVM